MSLQVSLKLSSAVDVQIFCLFDDQEHRLLPKKLDKAELFTVIHQQQTFIFLGLGKKANLSLTQLRIDVRKAMCQSEVSKARKIAIVPPMDRQDIVAATIEGILIGGYAWRKYKTSPKNFFSIDQQQIIVLAKPQAYYQQLLIILQGLELTRNLVNDNAQLTDSLYLEKTVKGLIKNHRLARLEILNRQQLAAKGLNLHLAVNQGSHKEPKLIIVHYQGASKNEPLTAIVGKGMTFDTGGLNLKPTGGIETMKIDMAGAAAVCGILKNVLSLKLKKNILFVLGVAENAISSTSYKPGDVIVGYKKKSVEIGNTDAEGRLVLADAFSYIEDKYKPSTIIDLATLTGACVVALGFDYSGLFSNHQPLADELLQAADRTDDRLWQLPIYPEMKEYIKSPIADLKNTSSIKGAGASTAATFLQQFINVGTHWAHLDIAGSCYAEGTGRMYFGYGATGSGVRVLTEYLIKN